MPPSTHRALVIGAASGLGAACVRELHSRGSRVAAVSRNSDQLQDLRQELDPDHSGAVITAPHDVRDHAAVPDLFTRVVGQLGGLDMIVYNAGVMPRIDVDTYDTDKDRLVIEVNLLGAMAWLNRAAPFLKEQGHGSIIGISSIAGERGRRGYPAYNTSKSGLNTYLEALRNRLHRHGVRVTTIKPGYIDTAMTEGLEGLFWLLPAERAARAIIDAGMKGAHTRYVPRRWALVGLAIRNIPSWLFRRMDI